MTITLDRGLDPATDAALQSGALTMCPILYLDFPSLTKYYAGANINIDLVSGAIMPAGIYVGVGGISSINAAEESSELKSTSITAQLNGLDSTYIALVLAENYYGKDASLGLVTLDSSHAVVGEPLLLFKGFMSILTADVQSDFAVTVELESILANWERPRVKRYNSAEQENVDPNDRGFDNVAELVSKEIVWGK